MHEPAVAVPRHDAHELFTRQFWTACSVQFCAGMGLSLYILFPLFIRHLGGSEFIIGLYAGLTGAAAVAVRLPLARLLDTQGRRRVLPGAGLLHVATWIAFLWITRLGVLSVSLVVLLGLASGSLFTALMTYANDITPITRRSEGVGMFAVWGMLPNGLGPWLGDYLIQHAGFHTYFLVAASFAALSLGLTQLLPETMPSRATGTDGEAGALFPYRDLLVLLGTTLVFAAAINGLFTFLAPFTQRQGGSGVGRFFMSYALTAVAVRVLTGRLPDRVGLRRVLVAALFLYAGGVLLVPWFNGAGALIAIGVICGAGHGYAFPILNALMVEQVSPTHRGRAVSWLTAMFDLGNTLANPLLGAVAEWAGYAAMFSAAGAAVLVTTALLWRKWAPL